MCLRMWWIMFSWVGGVGFWVCFVRHEMDFASHSCHKNQNKSSAAFSVTDTFVFLCKQTVRVQRDKNGKRRWMKDNCEYVRWTVGSWWLINIRPVLKSSLTSDYNWPRSRSWNGAYTFSRCMESRPCCAPIVHSLPRATVHPEPDHKFPSVSWGWRFSCQGESWDSLNSHWMDCRKCKSVSNPERLRNDSSAVCTLHANTEKTYDECTQWSYLNIQYGISQMALQWWI